MIAAGTYRAFAKAAELGFTSKGNPQIAVSLALINNEDEPTGETITWFGFFTDATKERTIESLRYCGWIGNDLSDLKGIGTLPVDVVIEHDTYEGKTRAKAQWINRPGGGVFKMEKPMDEAQKRKFAASMKALAATVPAIPGAGVAKPASKPASGSSNGNPPTGDDWGGNPPPHGDDEIGF